MVYLGERDIGIVILTLPPFHDVPQRRVMVDAGTNANFSIVVSAIFERAFQERDGHPPQDVPGQHGHGEALDANHVLGIRGLRKRRLVYIWHPSNAWRLRTRHYPIASGRVPILGNLAPGAITTGANISLNVPFPIYSHWLASYKNSSSARCGSHPSSLTLRGSLKLPFKWLTISGAPPNIAHSVSNIALSNSLIFLGHGNDRSNRFAMHFSRPASIFLYSGSIALIGRGMSTRYASLASWKSATRFKDASEAYLVDMPRPIKAMLPGMPRLHRGRVQAR